MCPAARAACRAHYEASWWTADVREPDPDEHRRYVQYLDDLANVREDDEAGLVATILRDPDAAMAQSAVAKHLDNRAKLLPAHRFAGWARAMTTVLAEHEFVSRRLREWTLLKSIDDGQPWTTEDITAASDWCQRQAAETSTSVALLAFLAADGRTRRVRAAASQRLRQPARDR